MNKFLCEICGNDDFYEYDYPTYVTPLKRKIFLQYIRRYFINVAKFFIRIVSYFYPRLFSLELRKKAFDSYKKINSFYDVYKTISKIENTTLFFRGRKIFICKKCDLGTVNPRISEEELNNYYKKDYWVANLGELEPAESNRTIITYKLLKDNINFSLLKLVLEFGSASAHISRYMKSKENKIFFDAVDSGIIWESVLKDELREVYGDINLIKNKYDLIVSSHALEHVSSVKNYFIKFFNLLNNGGYIYFEIPNSEERDLIFDNKNDYHIPHTYFFTPKSFVNIAETFGFKVIFIKTFSRSYGERFLGLKRSTDSMTENHKGAYIRVLLKK